MKQIKNIRNFLLISLIAGGTWIGCDDANYSTLDTHVFFEEALTATSTKVTVMGSGETNVTLNAHISNTQQKDSFDRRQRIDLMSCGAPPPKAFTAGTYFM